MQEVKIYSHAAILRPEKIHELFVQNALHISKLYQSTWEDKINNQSFLLFSHLKYKCKQYFI